MRTTLGVNDGSRVTDPTPATPGDDAVEGRDLTSTIVYPDVPGPLPVVVFTHGLGSSPEAYDELLSAWALAGFFVVAPHYPLTAAGTAQVFDDVANQPADVSFVLDAVLELNQTPDDSFEGLLDPERIAVAGHSAGRDHHPRAAELLLPRRPDRRRGGAGRGPAVLRRSRSRRPT